jgi:O-antigen ligase
MVPKSQGMRFVTNRRPDLRERAFREVRQNNRMSAGASLSKKGKGYASVPHIVSSAGRRILPLRRDYLNAGIFVGCWIVLYVGSIIDMGPLPGIFFLAANIYLIAQDVLYAPLLVILLMYTPIKVLQLPYATLWTVAVFLVVGMFRLKPARVRASLANGCLVWQLLFVTYTLVTYMWSPSMEFFTHFWVHYAVGGLFSLLVCMAVQTPAQVTRVLRVWALCAGAAIIIAATHRAFGTSTHLYTLASENLQRKISLPSSGPLAYDRLIWPGIQPNYYGASLLIPLGIAVGFVVDAKRSLVRYRYMAVLCLIVCGVIGTMSRSSILAACVIFVLFVAHRRGFLLGIAVVILSIALVYALPKLYERLSEIPTNITYEGGEGRLDRFQAAWALFLEHPVGGVGLGAFSQSTPYEGTQNSILQVLAETGVVGFLIYSMSVILAFIRKGAPSRKEERLARSSAISYGLRIGLVAYCLNLNTIENPDVRWLWMACVLCYIGTRFAETSRASSPHVTLSKSTVRLRPAHAETY